LGEKERKKKNILIFSAYTDACTYSCKIVVASKRPLIKNSNPSVNIGVQREPVL